MKKIKLRLQVPNGLSITGNVSCHERKHSNEYQIPHRNPWTKEEIQAPLYEIEVNQIMSQILPQKSMESFSEDGLDLIEKEKIRREELVRGLHIEIGETDLLPYICFPNLKEENLILAVRMWLVHQALFVTEGINFGFFEGYVLHSNSDFDDWLQNNKYMQSIPEYQRLFLKTKESLFRTVREIYNEKTRESYSAKDVVEIVIRVTGLTVSTEFEE